MGCDFTPRVHKTIFEAQDLLLNQKYDQAIQKYEQILQSSPNEIIKTKVAFQLSEIYLLHSGNNQRALKLLKSVLSESNNIDALVKAEEKIGDIYFSFTHNYSEASKCYKRLIAFRPKLPDNEFYLYRYARSELRNGKYKNAISLFKKLQNSKKYADQSLFYIGKSMFFNKQWKSAINTLSRYNDDSNSAKVIEAQFLIANAYESIGNLKKAYDTYYTLLAYYPNPEVIRNKLNSIYQRQISSKR